jgi:hypothetical protein
VHDLPDLKAFSLRAAGLTRQDVLWNVGLTVQNHFASPETRDADQHRRGQDCDQINRETNSRGSTLRDRTPDDQRD